MEKQTYDVADGVAWVNGEKTPRDRKVELTPVEAQYDLGLGRITLAPKTVAKPQVKPGGED